jgi:hypothetical protein
MTHQYEHNRNELLRWFRWLIVIGPIHVGEQLLFGIDLLSEIRAMFAVYYGYFQNADVGTVVLVILTVTMVQLLVYGGVAGGRARLLAAGFFGVMGAAEAHHILHTVLRGSYFPGLVTSFPFTGIGIMLLIAVVREWRETSRGSNRALAAATA